MGVSGNGRGAGSWTKFRLLMWKNALQQWRHPIQTAAQLIVPVIAMSLLLLLRFQTAPEYRSDFNFTSVPASTLNNSWVVFRGMNISKISLAYSPRSDVLEDVLTDSIVQLLLDNAVDLLAVILENPEMLPDITLPPDLFPEGLPEIAIPPDFDKTLLEVYVRSRIQSYDTSSELRGIYIREETTREVVAAVEFDDELLGATALPSQISYGLRFPSRPRQSSFFGVSNSPLTWRTDLLFPVFETAGPRSRSSDGGNDPGYVREMFIALQNAISTQLVSRITGESLESFEVNLQRYPHPAYLHDPVLGGLQALLPLAVILSFSYSAITIVSSIVAEKELQLRETMKIMGMPSWINWTAWFCKQFIFLMIAGALITVVIKVQWFSADFGRFGVITNTPWTVVFFFLVMYLICTILFCFMMSGFFSKGTTAAVVTSIVWFLTYLPAFLMAVEIEMPLALQYISCLGINSAASFGFITILASESVGGLQWGDFMTAPTVDHSRMLFGEILIMMSVNCVLYLLIALYLEQVLPGPFGTPKPWYFLCNRNFWRSSTIEPSTQSNLMNAPLTPEVIKEQDPIDHKVGVKMTNLTKEFGKNVVVNNLNLNIYDDQITVLLGHNGAGKSTTISMITGNLGATSGSVWVAGHDMTWHSSEARSYIGLCPQHNVLFKDLTVREHLEFFARLKGSQGKELEHDIKSIMDKLELQPKRNTRAGALSGGQKRRLCVGIALSGDSRVVLLDEPTSGMDPSSRRALWDLLQKEKKNRSMILTTHFMDEADILGDRIAIMAVGRLQCVGSPYFLKRHYGVGYTLVVVKDEGFNLDACIYVLKNYIPEVKVAEDRGSEVTFNLAYDQSGIFENMLKDLENNIGNIKYKNYGLLSTTMEDVFMKVGSDSETVQEVEDGDGSTDAQSDAFERTSIDGLSAGLPLTGFQLIVQHTLAVWLKLCLVYLRSWNLVLTQLLIPLLIVVSSLAMVEFIMGASAGTTQRRPLVLSEGFTATESLLNYDGENPTSLGGLATAAYRQMIEDDVQSMSVTTLEEPIDDFYFGQVQDGDVLARARHLWLTGATFTDNGATAWFSNFGYHDVAISLAAVHNALLKARNPAAELRVSNHPIEVQYEDDGDITSIQQLMSSQIADGVGLSLGIATAVYVLFYIKERAIRAKLLQKASGIQPVVLWGAAAVFDWVWFLIVCLTVILSCLGFGVVGLSSGAELGRLYLVMMIFGAAALPMIYLGSLFFEKQTMGFIVVFSVNTLFGYMGASVVGILEMLDVGTLPEVLDAVLQLLPLYSLIVSVRNIHSIGLALHTCMDMCESWLGNDDCSMAAMCELVESCCVTEDSHFTWAAPGILRYLLAMLGTCVIMWILLMCFEYNVWSRFRKDQVPPPLDPSAVDADVAAEAAHAQLAAASASHSLVASRLSKYYGKYLAVNQVSFSVGESECFGLLGVNGAGKTSTFKMLMGDERVSSGDAFVSGYSVRRNITKVHENIGYCPQFDALFGELTGRETLRLYSLLRGLSWRHTAARTAALAHALGFTKHLDKKVNQYSGGNKRKLSTAVALLGNTSLLFVDEPTTGVDPAAKRQVWRAIRNAMSCGRSVVLTSHSMEECEALCSRLTIMVNGRFQCLGSPQHLKNKYSQGFTLSIKIQKEDAPSADDATRQQSIATVKQYVESNFVNPSLMEEHQGMLTYYLSDRGASWSSMFGIMERGRQTLPMEDYRIAQTTLEQIFLQFTKYQQGGGAIQNTVTM